MNLQEAGAVLAKAAGYDNRSVGEANILAWHEALADLDVHDALDAVAAHHRESTEWCMPAHIRQLVKRIRDERRRIEQHHEVRALPSRFEDDVTRNLRVREGVAQCRDVLSAVMARLEAARAEHPSGLDALREATPDVAVFADPDQPTEPAQEAP